VGEKLGLEVEFKIIDWERKFYELNTGAIDAIWNGFTATAKEKSLPRSNFCDLSYSYMLNTQCVVVKTERLEELSSADDMAGTTLAAGSGSTGEEYATGLAGASGEVIGTAAQSDAFSEVLNGSVDGAVVDVALARLMIGDGDGDGDADGDRPGLSIAFELDPLVYAVGFKKGNSLRNQVNDAMKELFDDGVILELAIKYGIETNLVLDTSFGLDDCGC